jgi:hypothetical protein
MALYDIKYGLSKIIHQGQQFPVKIFGAQYFSSANIGCPYCLKTESAKGLHYHHQILQAVIVHPDIRQVIPLFLESIHRGYILLHRELPQ